MALARLLLALMALAATTTARAAEPPVLPMTQTEQAHPTLPPILSPRERAKVVDAILADRLERVIPQIMQIHQVDMWVLAAREYLEDPVVATMLDAKSLRARRRTILVFFDPGGGKPIERLTVSRYGLGGLFKPAWNPDTQPDQWKALADLIAARNPGRIALNTSSLTAFGDGLTKSQHDELAAALAPQFRERITSGEGLSVSWLETRTPMEMKLYPGIVRLAHAVLAEGHSTKAIKPGVTTIDDVEWFLRARLSELGLDTWFHPSVGAQRQGVKALLDGDTVIQPGDLLWTDFGITYLRLNTDTQHLAYVLKPGETEAPAGLEAGLAAANRVQDALTAAFQMRVKGNDVLAAARKAAIEQGLKPSIYSHPLGYHGHGAGPAIGFWDKPERGPARELPGQSRHGLVHRAVGLRARAGVGRPGGAVPHRGGRLLRRQDRPLPRRPPDRAHAHPIPLSGLSIADDALRSPVVAALSDPFAAETRPAPVRRRLDRQAGPQGPFVVLSASR